MKGHAVGYLTDRIAEPIISDPNESDGKDNRYRMTSYHFFSQVEKKGEHTLKLFWAGC